METLLLQHKPLDESVTSAARCGLCLSAGAAALYATSIALAVACLLLPWLFFTIPGVGSVGFSLTAQTVCLSGTGCTLSPYSTDVLPDGTLRIVSVSTAIALALLLTSLVLSAIASCALSGVASGRATAPPRACGRAGTACVGTAVGATACTAAFIPAFLGILYFTMVQIVLQSAATTNLGSGTLVITSPGREAAV